MTVLESLARLIDRTGVEPVAWRAPEPPSPGGVLAPNDYLDGAEQWRLPVGKGPEDVAVDHEGRVVTGGDDGKIWRFDRNGTPTQLADTRGRPLGIETLDDGRFLVCDTQRGLLRVDVSGRVDLLADTAAGSPLTACNNSAVGRDGIVYFTDSSSRFSVADHRLDILEHSGTGRLLRFDVATGETDVLADGLQFANGVGLAADETHLLVAETGAYSVSRVELSGPDAGMRSVIAENLPGLPDNITSETASGLFWVALYSPRMKLLDMIAPYPNLRVLAANIPEKIQPSPEQAGWVVAIDSTGTVVHSLRGGRGSYAPVTGVREHGEWLYLGSLTAGAVARVPAPRRYERLPGGCRDVGDPMWKSGRATG
ncbi:SMP-30/gluconolactonase/LRE family protein [Rhodococcus sp. NPDC058521]|uniref:SMP-30/gluconolactonase/LRE family protein n=1 Tax=Rhodococcus sp. NPDC058521 TaxID=3346536 RepID=UPI003656261A